MQTLNSIKNKKIKFSNHALIRMNQRGISEKTFPVFQNYGHLTYVKEAMVLSLDQREKKYIRSDLDEKTFRKIEKQLNTYYVISHDGTVITAARSYRKLRRQ